IRVLLREVLPPSVRVPDVERYARGREGGGRGANVLADAEDAVGMTHEHRARLGRRHRGPRRGPWRGEATQAAEAHPPREPAKRRSRRGQASPEPAFSRHLAPATPSARALASR